MDFNEICRAFSLPGDMAACTVIKNGNINKTYKLDFISGASERSYILQKINTYVFKKPENIMSNINGVTEHIYTKLPEEKRERGVQA